MNDLQPLLGRLGLTEKEIVVYLTLLSVGSAPAAVLSRRSKTARSTTHFVCEQLVRHGIAHVIRRNGVTQYVAEAPEQLETLLHRRRDELDQAGEDLHRAMGHLHALVSPHTVLPQVEFHEGPEGFVRAYEEMLDRIPAGEETLSFLRPLDIVKDPFHLAAGFERFVAKRTEKRIRARALASDCDTSRRMIGKTLGGLRETRIVKQDLFGDASVEILLWGDVMFSAAVEHDTLFACTITNASIARMLRAIFETMWAITPVPKST